MDRQDGAEAGQGQSSGLGVKRTLIRKDTCSPVFTAALFTIVKTWKQPKCPLTDEWIKKKWYTHMIEYYLAIKKNGTLPSAVTWMDLKGIMLREVMSERERQILYDVTYTWALKNSRN